MINRDEFRSIEFESHGIIDMPQQSACRVPKGFQPMQNQKELAFKIGNIVQEYKAKYQEEHPGRCSQYALVEKACDIPIDTIKRLITGRTRVTRTQLAKLCVGLKLPIENADRLFFMQGGLLNLSNDFDYIVYHALADGDDIYSFIGEVREYTKVRISDGT
ncbi:helix-turn-helix domain-containing protein [Selenomonas sp. ND2010]|uniref:helix-turn-helix domain-containing protein n=1 Tax=Selenomonas sp. ND2010 TaxID=1410618 RepID=UPI00051AC4B8|nr:helix-turn-helix domain-containing protein [Selenomonas sp. ND2010]